MLLWIAYPYKPAPCWAYSAHISTGKLMFVVVSMPQTEQFLIYGRNGNDVHLHRASQITDAFHIDPPLRRSLFALRKRDFGQDPISHRLVPLYGSDR
jgi:hypothetical protein